MGFHSHKEAVRDDYSGPRLRSSHEVDIYSYFRNLEDRDITKFGKMWGQIRSCNFSGKHLSGILDSIAAYSDCTADDAYPEKSNYLNIIKNRFSVWENAALHRNPDFLAIQQVQVLVALAKLGICPSEEFMKQWHREARCNRSYFGIPAVTKSCWSLAIMDSINPHSVFRAIYNDIRSWLPEKDIHSTGLKKQLFDADFWFTGSSTVENPKNRRSHISGSEMGLQRIFTQAHMDIPHTRGPVLPTLPQAVDFVVEKDNQRMLVELDGPSHFLRASGPDPSRRQFPYNGQTLFRSALIQRLAPEERLLRIDYDICNTVIKSSSDCRHAFCARLFHAAVNQEPGVYRACLTGEPVQPLFTRDITS